jgi:hypothetical protein
VQLSRKTLISGVVRRSDQAPIYTLLRKRKRPAYDFLLWEAMLLTILILLDRG